MNRQLVKSNAVMTLALAASLTFACGDDSNSEQPPDAGDNGGGDAGNPPDPDAFPALGAQLDRAGRPATASMLIASMLHADQAAQVATRSDYRSDDDPSMWVGTWQSEIDTSIAFLDGLNSTAVTSGCGDQLDYDGGGGSDYDALSATLADDRLRVDPEGTACAQYLAVETGASGAGECGGRTPVMDVIETSYSALTSGDLSGTDDGVAADDATHNADTFPFLAPPGGS
jgi:hypothetical protein